MNLQTIDSIPIGVSGQEVIDAFRPFMCGPERSADARRQIRIMRWNAAKRGLRRLAGGRAYSGTRNTEVIAGEYEGAWSRGFAAYDLAAGCRKPEPWLWRGRSIVADRSGVPRFRNVILGGVIRAMRPRRVLEVGCGNGINLLLLANQFPDVHFAGLELTESGNRVAREMQSLERLPEHLAAYMPGAQEDTQAFRRIDFVRGDATAMPFGAGEFDLVVTVLAVEQMERVRDRALAEIARVSGGHVLNMEPFRDANRTLMRRLHVFARDYFRGAIDELPRYGLKPLWASMDFPQEVQLGAALVLSRKT
jgi:SAM-dependent methyltransferase